jgi:GTP cyclohydrolase I
VIVRCHRVIKVEDILAAVESFTTEPVLQEQFTRQLAARLRAEVETIGFHSGVETRVVA